MADLYADHNVARPIVFLLRALGHVVTSTQDMGLARATDDVQLLMAAQRGWIVLTHNRRDFVLLDDAWRRWSGAWGVAPRHPGIVVAPQEWPHARVAGEVDAFLRSTPPLENELYTWQPLRG